MAKALIEYLIRVFLPGYHLHKDPLKKKAAMEKNRTEIVDRLSKSVVEEIERTA